MTKRLKKVLCVLSVAACIFGSSISAYAIEFNVTPPSDPFSRVVKKNDTEQNAYVTGLGFSKSGTLYAYSQQCLDNNIRSDTMAISPSSPRDVKPYRRFAKAQLDYEMFSYASTVGLNVHGRFTP